MTDLQANFDVHYEYWTEDGTEALVKGDMVVEAVDEDKAEETVLSRLAASHPELPEGDWDVEIEARRPDEATAASVIDAFLEETYGEIPDYSLHEDGERGWAFWICEEDTTSYLHPELRVEWYGTSWDPDEDSDPEEEEVAAATFG